MAYVAIYTDIHDMHILASAPSAWESPFRGGLGRSYNASASMECEARVQESSLSLPPVDTRGSLHRKAVYRACQDNFSLRPWSLYHAALIL